MVSDLPMILLDQWQPAPKLRAIIDDVIAPVRGDTLGGIDALDLYQRLDSAEGVWLDRLGDRIGMARPSTSDPTIDRRFGFDDAGVGFDQRPFRGDAANDAVYPLPDEVYRRILRARVVTLLGDGTATTLLRSAREIDPSVSVQDQRTMTVRVVTNEPDLLRLADLCGALPRSAGVSLTYADRGRFGFDDAGVGFDQGPFAGD